MNASKSKMVSFRLSPAEYEHYRAACAGAGVGNLSDLARKAIHQLVGERKESAPLESHVSYLRERVGFLSREVERLAERIEERSGERANVRVNGVGSTEHHT